ncbi:hypothetical protein BK702_04905 [Bacillus thuringiensis serovar cameroun]|nr:hypothetical protein BK702_04905 [Bacillus thuringiensis serovar cameroun]
MVKYAMKILWFSQQHEMLSYLKKQLSFACYKIQQYIPWATIGTHVFTVKVILHRRKNSSTWNITEKYVEARHTILPIKHAIQCSNVRGMDVDQLILDIEHIALQIIQNKDDLFLPHRSVGVDISLDYNGEIWITQICSNPVKMKGNKKNMHTLFKTDPYLSIFIPETKEFEMENENTLLSFLHQYHEVIVKPISGSLGKGIMRIVVDANSQYTVQHTNKIFQFTNASELFLFLKQKIQSKPYLIQQYIQLAKVKDSPFDLRVIVQKKSNDCTWKVTGIFAKVAFDGYFTTNLAKKGTAMAVSQAIHSSNLKGINSEELLQKIYDVALRVAQNLEGISPHHRIWGLDMGVDFDGTVWMIEVNSKPGLKGFKSLENQSMFQTIQNYKQ